MNVVAIKQTKNRYVREDERWAAVVARDRSADGVFFTAVKTTGVYCLPSCAGRPLRKNVEFFDTIVAAERAGYRACKRCKPNGKALDWNAIQAELDAQGCARVEAMLSPAECTALGNLYDDDTKFRGRVVMARHAFGRGEYKYLAYPLPDLVRRLRTELYPPLAAIANRWNAAMNIETRFPATHAEFLERCHEAGQVRPTPLLLRYGAGDYNCLHQDLYGKHVFPLQIAFLLSEPERDFTGGEFVLTEQRPRMQSRAEVVPLKRGDGVVFPVHHRPVQGTRGIYRTVMRHGVSRLRSGHRMTLGLIFHDAE